MSDAALLVDEADSFLSMTDDLRGILNAGHTQVTAFVVRAEGAAKEPRMFSTFAPKAVAAIGRLPDTIEDRSIRVVLARKPKGVKTEDAFDGEAVAARCAPVRLQLARFALDHADEIKAALLGRPDGLGDRAWNNWRPLLAIREAAASSHRESAKRHAREHVSSHTLRGYKIAAGSSLPAGAAMFLPSVQQVRSESDRLNGPEERYASQIEGWDEYVQRNPPLFTTKVEDAA